MPDSCPINLKISAPREKLTANSRITITGYEHSSRRNPISIAGLHFFRSPISGHCWRLCGSFCWNCRDSLHFHAQYYRFWYVGSRCNGCGTVIHGTWHRLFHDHESPQGFNLYRNASIALNFCIELTNWPSTETI